MDTVLQDRSQNDPLLKMSNIGISFPGVRALNNVDFTLRRGEVHALMGENGAGKSTLIKVLTGVYRMDGGSIALEGKPVVIHSPQSARKHAISTVYQEVNLCPNLTVAENLFLGHEPRKLGLIDWKKIKREAVKILERLNISADPMAQLDTCSIATQQLIVIARAVIVECKILILDEPTSSLDENEVQKLFSLMRQLKGQGVGIIFITHFLEQVYEVCDRITVLRNGELVGEYKIENLPRVELVTKMIGKEIDDLAEIKPEEENVNIYQGNIPLVEARGLSSGASTIAPFDIKILKGEVIGFSGLLGSGRSELVRAIYGADRATEGELLLKGENKVIKTPLDAIKERMAYLPEDRKKDGIFADLSVRENIIIALQTKHGIFKRMIRKEMVQNAEQYISWLNIKTPSIETPIKNLSGGNQQKVILARWLLTSPDFLILDEPTRGIDIGTKTEIQKLVIKLAEEGKSVAFISSELDEMLRTCSRMVIMRDRKKIGELSGSDISQEKIMQTIAGTSNEVSGGGDHA